MNQGTESEVVKVCHENITICARACVSTRADVHVVTDCQRRAFLPTRTVFVS